jgi:hypothetical protein
LSLTSEVATAN